MTLCWWRRLARCQMQTFAGFPSTLGRQVPPPRVWLARGDPRHRSLRCVSQRGKDSKNQGNKLRGREREEEGKRFRHRAAYAS